MPDTSGERRRRESGSPPLQAAGTLWLVRHGESGWNVARRIQGQSPAAPGLTAIGRSQAAEAVLELARRAPRADLIVASDLLRTAETVEIITARLGLPVEFDPGLREQSLGALEGGSAFVAAGADGANGADGASSAREGGAARGYVEADGTDRAAENGAAEGAAEREGAAAEGGAEREGAAAEGGAERDLLKVFWEDPFRTPPGGESVADMYDRVHRALNRITAAYPEADLIVVTHGGPVRVAAAAYPPEPGQAFPRTDVGNASITPYRPPSR